MELGNPENLRIIAETMRRFVDKPLEPIADRVEDPGRIPAGVLGPACERGRFGGSIPARDGGQSEVPRPVIARELPAE